MLSHAVEPDTRRTRHQVAGIRLSRLPVRQAEEGFMWHHGRCASTVQGRILNQHPGIRWSGGRCENYAEAGIPRPYYQEVEDPLAGTKYEWMPAS